ncbi:MAG: hypothetical protein RI897_3845 [Verrucomicrobiota bacterium]
MEEELICCVVGGQGGGGNGYPPGQVGWVFESGPAEDDSEGDGEEAGGGEREPDGTDILSGEEDPEQGVADGTEEEGDFPGRTGEPVR